MEMITVKTSAHSQAVDITGQVQKIVADAGEKQGWCLVFVPHTTAAVAINEAADPSVMQDVFNALEKMVPWRGDYRHTEGNAAAHVKSMLMGSSVRVPVTNGRLSMGTWQGISSWSSTGPAPARPGWIFRRADRWWIQRISLRISRAWG